MPYREMQVLLQLNLLEAYLMEHYLMEEEKKVFQYVMLVTSLQYFDNCYFHYCC
jgi:hypothetical protein